MQGSPQAHDEMCYFELMYYPSANLQLCTWKPNYEDIWHYFGVNEVADDKVRIISPAALRNQTMLDVIRHYNWTTVDETKMGKLISMLYDGKKNITCLGQETEITVSVNYPIDIPTYIPPPDTCETAR